MLAICRRQRIWSRWCPVTQIWLCRWLCLVLAEFMVMWRWKNMLQNEFLNWSLKMLLVICCYQAYNGFFESNEGFVFLSSISHSLSTFSGHSHKISIRKRQQVTNWDYCQIQLPTPFFVWPGFISCSKPNCHASQKFLLLSGDSGLWLSTHCLPEECKWDLEGWWVHMFQ
jgi:hypothetical protein